MINGAEGILYLCATPIGNLEDISLRALRILKEVDFIAAEDTRRTRKLLAHYAIHTPLISYHEHNKRTKGKYILNMLLEGKNAALVTDAGLPGISDPGEEIVKLSLNNKIKVVPIPGPSASLTALVVSGLETKTFCFEGFLPTAASARKKRLDVLKKEKRTLIFYEAPHRLQKTLGQLLAVFGDRRIAIARELTKMHEEIWRGKLSAALLHFEKPKGEFTLIVEGDKEDSPGKCAQFSTRAVIEKVLSLETEGVKRSQAIKDAAVFFQISRRDVYAALIQEKESRNY
jgi:16S rRNA (cytidine1402-2'-O)-methyltransferase